MKPLALCFCAASLLWLCSCGGGSVNGTLGGNTAGNFTNANFSGAYAFLLEGDNSAGFFRAGGVMNADGKGSITSGIFDIAQSGAGAATSLSFTGVYTVAKDGSGQATLNLSNGSSLALELAIASSRVYMIEADSIGNAGGFAENQDASAFSAVPNGTFVFTLHGQRSAGSSGVVGLFTASGGGFTGNEDLNQAGTLTPSLGITGTITAPGTNGRGSLAITDANGFTATFNYYVVKNGNLRLLSADTNQLSGRAELQSAGPFSAASLSGGYAFGSKGDTTTFNGVQTVGRFTSNGAGKISAGVFDSVQDGNVFTGVNFAGTYAVDSSGRALVNLNSSNGAVQQIFRVVSPQRVFFLVNSTAKVEDGTIDLQQPAPLSAGTLNGQFAFFMHGFDTSNNVDRDGLIQLDGQSKISFSEVVNRDGVVNAPGTLTGNYSVMSNGRGAANVNGLSSNLVFYIVSGSQAYLLQGDAGAGISGAMTHQ
jgi:hypothetical protein